MLIRVLIIFSLLFSASVYAGKDHKAEVLEDNEGDAFLKQPHMTFREWNPSLTDNEVISQACCKQCNKGKACGNSCISRDKTCHKGSGCACD